jgi:hypothetical protein
MRGSVAVSVLAEALVRWQHAAGPFWPYVCAAPFLGTGESQLLAARLTDPGSIARFNPSRVSPRYVSLAEKLLAAVDTFPRSRARGMMSAKVLSDVVLRNDSRAPQERASRRIFAPRSGLGGGGSPAAVVRGGSPDGGSAGDSPSVSPAHSFPVLLADLPAEPLLAIAPLLTARGWYVVPVVQRWIASPAVLPCRPLMQRLLLGAWQMQRPSQPRGAILIADGERTGPVGYPHLAAGRTFDNRYEYQICRFPSTRFLHGQGVRRVTWMTTGRPASRPGSSLGEPTLGIPPVARDLHPYREMLLQAGIDVAVNVWPRP